MQQRDFILDGKKYISAKQASLLTGYTSDYIGQLCRGSKIDSQRIGRVWFVAEEAILNYEKGNPDTSSSVSGSNVADAQSSEIFTKKSEISAKTPSFTSSAVRATQETGFQAPLMPPVGSAYREEKEESDQKAKLAVIIQNALKTQNKEARQKKSTRDQIEAILGEEVIAPLGNQKTIIAGIACLVIFLGSLGYGFLSTRSVSSSSVVVETRTANALSAETSPLVAAVFLPIARTVNTLALFEYSIISPLFGGDVVCRSMNDYCAASREAQGMVVLPQTSSPESDARTQDKVKESFSDEVSVVPGAKDGAGVVKPVFKDATDDSYMYVLVPIQN